MKLLILIGTLIMGVLLFASIPIDSSSRLFQSVWNTGHLFLFACVIGLLISQTRLYRLSHLNMLMLSLGVAVSLGALIEFLQYFVSRSVSVDDVYLDVLGAFLGFLWIQFTLPAERKPWPKLLVILLGFVCVALTFIPVINVLKVNAQLEQNLPGIADFETDESLGLWIKRGIEQFQRDSTIYREGSSSARVEFKISEYPDITLEVLHPDWVAYRYLNLSIYNDQNDTLNLVIKIYDRAHSKRGYQHNDRFNQALELKPGWNDVRIKLLDVYNSPAQRKMDLSDIMGISLFLINPPTQKTIHLDNIYLSK